MSARKDLPSKPIARFGILVDVTKCTGCERCVDACVESNGLDPVAAARDRATVRDGLSANRLSTVISLGSGRYARKSCMHCEDPSCVSACLVGGLTKTPEGPVVYDPDKCIGCRYCILACPYHVPRYEWDRTLPLMKKCNMCFESLKQGEVPACVSACPQQAMEFGERDSLLAKAWSRIRTEPGKYLARVWGQDEWGGSAVLYVSDTDLSPVGFPDEATRAIPSITEPIIHRTPQMGFGVAVTLTGLRWVLQRRDLLMNAPENAARDETSEENHG